MFTADFLGLTSVRNGDLVAYAERHGFEVLVTADKNLSYQQNLAGRSLALVVLSTNQWAVVRRNFDAIANAVDAVHASAYLEVLCL